jgi:hypothetical protein
LPVVQVRYCADPLSQWLAQGTSAGTSSGASTGTWSLNLAGLASTAATMTVTNVTVSSLIEVTGCATTAVMTFNAACGVEDTPENRAEAHRVLAEAHAELNRIRDCQQVADARAHQLLLSVLTAEETRSYLEHGFIELQGSAGGWWRIRRQGQAGNVDELEGPGGERVASWCCHPPGHLPDADAHLAQLLQLWTDEPGFRAVGNRTPRRRLPAPV